MQYEKTFACLSVFSNSFFFVVVVCFLAVHLISYHLKDSKVAVIFFLVKGT